jgi:Asp-tRNA(Asn)/Glu-tRNA(Gln) amidotransferase A subunit family amidase
MRQQLIDDNGVVCAKFHEPVYRDLFIHNRLEERRSQQGLFTSFVLQAIQRNLIPEKGDCITGESAEVSIESKQIAAQRRRAAGEEQSTNECWQMAATQFASLSEQNASMERVSMQRSTAMDKIMVQRQHIVRTYNLQEVRMVKEAPTVLLGAAGQAGKMEAQKIQEDPYSLSSSTHSEAHLVRASSASAVSSEAVPREVEHADAAASSFTATFAAFIREHHETAQFQLFRRANEPLTVLWNRWKSKAISCPGETAMDKYG